MKELVASRIPPGDRWALIESESDIVYGSLTDCLNQIYVVHKSSQFFIKHFNISQLDITAKDSEYAKGTSTDAIGEWMQKQIRNFNPAYDEAIPEVDGITFTRAGRHLAAKKNTAKIDFIKQYKVNKLNA